MRVPAIQRMGSRSVKTWAAIETSFLYVIPKSPSSGLGLRLTQMSGSFQREAKFRRPASLVKVALHVFRMVLFAMTFLLISRRAACTNWISFLSLYGSHASFPSFVRYTVLFFDDSVLICGMMISWRVNAE